MSTNNAADTGEVVEVARPGKQPRVLRGISARWVLYIMDYAEFLNDPRNRGVIEFHFLGAKRELNPVARIEPQI